MCALTKLSFEPPVIYCSSCGLRIKRGQIFYSTPPDHGNDLKGYFCHQCFTDQKGERILVEGVSIKKSDLVVSGSRSGRARTGLYMIAGDDACSVAGATSLGFPRVLPRTTS